MNTLTTAAIEARRVKEALVDLLLMQPFFASLALRLNIIPDAEAETAWTDGVSLAYSPAFVAGLSRAEITGLMAHEVMHVANGHPWREEGRDHGRWNQACDYAINPVVTGAGMKLPPNALVNRDFEGLSSEAIYPRLPVPPASESGGQPASADPGRCGEVRPAPGGAEARAESQQQWQSAVLQAAQAARDRGTLPAGIDRICSEIAQPPCRNLVAAIMEWAQRMARTDYSYTRPNRRYLPHGLYMPSLRSTALPPIVAAIDTSGSIDERLLHEYRAALQTVLDECRPESLLTMDCDAAVHSVTEFAPGDQVTCRFAGGGGTDFRPVFDRVAADKLEPAGLIYFTDQAGVFPYTAPEYPVLWVVIDTDGARNTAPWGETIWLR
ncbi:MAG TPA: VWA-like domain-containing protein [Candidatus Sulfopaludibacter sp.]|nr:VWA-like domain-containing protein [Candidatus Sulfopaludibacter sp.]